MFERSKLRKAITADLVSASREILAKKPDLANMTLSDYGPRALSIALNGGSLEMVRMLVDAGARLDISGQHGRTMLFDAVRHGRMDVLQDWSEAYSTLFHERSYDKKTLLHEAAIAGHEDIVLWLMETKGIDSEARNDNGRTALFFAEKHQHEKVRAILKPLQDQSLKGYRAKARTLAGHQDAGTPWKLLDSARVARVQDDEAIGYRLTEIFNFATLERTRLYRNLDSNAESAETRGFCDLPSAARGDVLSALAVLATQGHRPVDAQAIRALMPVPATPLMIEKKP